MIAPFNPAHAMAGGALLGLGLALLFVLRRHPTGVSGVLSGLLAGQEDVRGRVTFLFGLLVSGVVAVLVAPGALRFDIDRSLGTLAVAGALVGVGARLANGCTSGHGVCGVSRLAPRSLAATALFMTAGAVTVFFINHLLGRSA